MTTQTTEGVLLPVETAQAIKAIAEGYPITVWGDRWIRVENPDFKEDNGTNPGLVIDAWAFATLNPSTVEEGVKPLEWHDKSIAIMVYHAECDDDGEWRYVVVQRGKDTPYTLKRYGVKCGEFPSVEVAKAAAQADFESRIRSSLIPATMAGEGAATGRITTAQMIDASKAYDDCQADHISALRAAIEAALANPRLPGEGS